MLLLPRAPHFPPVLLCLCVMMSPMTAAAADILSVAQWQIISKFCGLNTKYHLTEFVGQEFGGGICSQVVMAQSPS